MKSSAVYLFLAIILLSLNGGCATHRTADMLKSRLNQMDYEEALQNFGQPTQCAESGSTRECTWVRGEGEMVSMPAGDTTYVVPVEPHTAHLTFHNGVLTEWQLSGDWE